MPQLAAGVPFYGAAPAVEDVPKIKAALVLHFAEQDPNINGRWPDYEAALKANGVKYEPISTPKRIMGFITIRHRVMTQKRRNSLGSARSITSTRR